MYVITGVYIMKSKLWKEDKLTWEQTYQKKQGRFTVH